MLIRFLMLVYDWMWWEHLTNQNFGQRYAGFLLDNMLSLWVCILLKHTIKEESIILHYHLLLKLYKGEMIWRGCV